MKTFNKTFLPDKIIYNKKEYVRDQLRTDLNRYNRDFDKCDCIKVHVLAKQLRGKKDLRGREYKPTIHIYSRKKSYYDSAIHE